MKTIKKLTIAIFSFLLINNLSASVISMEETTINSVVAQYLKLKDALVKSNASDATTAAISIRTALKKIQFSDNETKKLVDGIFAGIDGLTKTEKLNEQREKFQIISDNLYNLIGKLKAENILYRQFCPMAFDNKGGHWLSAEKEVRNPYFGDAMLKCGKVVETIK